MDWNNLDQYESTESLSLAMEVPVNEGNNHINQFKGWFIPPATTRYRFYQVCDDTCRIKMALDNSDPTNITTVIETTNWADYRNYYTF